MPTRTTPNRVHPGLPTWADALHAGHTAMMANHHQSQSLVATWLSNGIGHVVPTGWKSATPDMRTLEIGSGLEGMRVAIDDLGGRRRRDHDTRAGAERREISRHAA